MDEATFKTLDVTPTAYLLSTMVDSVVVWYRPEGRLGVQDVLALYEDQALSMVASSAPRKRQIRRTEPGAVRRPRLTAQPRPAPAP